MKKIVHLSGYSLAEIPGMQSFDQAGKPLVGRSHDWEEVCWGNPMTAAMGRIPMAIWVATAIQADAIIWSTGCSRTEAGDYEAHFMHRRTLMHGYHGLRHDFPHRFAEQISQHEFERWLDRVSFFDAESTTTSTSMEIARELVQCQWGSIPAMIYFVSSANHLPRVSRDAMKAFGIGTEPGGRQNLITATFVAAETNYGKKLVTDTVVRDLGN